ncbi:MAG TPA: LapA family protein [Acidimicrobiales bacterium]|nr:LapA family protein [Acidimicrobiales bacterium]
MIVGALLVLATVIVLVQNTDAVPFEFLWFEVEVPLGVLLLIAGLVTFAAGELIGVLWRRRRRRVRTMQRELDSLRRG